MNEEYDCVVMGTGLTECVVSGLLSTHGYKVLHVDKNDYYGGDSASLHLDQLYAKFKSGESADFERLGRNRDYYVDLIPKFLMANGKLERMLHLTGVTKYNMEFVKVSKCFVMGKKGKICKVPSTVGEVMKSSLMGFMEKNRCRKLVSYVHGYELGKPGKFGDLEKQTMNEFYKKCGVNEDTIDFLGHAVALESSEAYRERPAWPTCEKMRLYADSLAKYGDSPFIYPLYGLGELPQVFARLCAVYGGTYMLDTPITSVNYGEDGCVESVESSEKFPGEKAKCKFIVADPSYFPDKVEKKGQIIRVINILDHPLPSVKDADSCQIIIPSRQSGRENDIYVCCTMSKHKVCPKGKYLAIVATSVETEDPLSEVKIALDLLGKIEEQFVYILDYFEPKTDGKKDKVFLSKSYDASSHFETCSNDIIDIFERVTGKPFSWEKKDSQKEKKEKESMN